jgi:polysaccharide biosynthesis protein PslG
MFLSTLVCVVLVRTVSAQSTSASTATESPFGIASGAEWAGEYPKFEPMLRQAGVGWLRYFNEWSSIQPKPGEWDWKRTDDFVAATRANGLQIAGAFLYFAPWASSGGDTRTFPVKDMQYWKDYVAGVVSRYGDEVRYWEMWNEPQAFQKEGTPQHYADMVRSAYVSAKKANPRVNLGLTSANYAIAYLNMVLKAGAADHFDYLCVHPYENMEQLRRPGGEVYFLSMAGNLRRLLESHQQRADIPLWITEIGWQVPIKPDEEKDALQAQLLVKAYVLSLAQGFDKVFWFEARGPAYGHGTDHGIIRADWTPRPAMVALKSMTSALGESPRPAGWIDFEGSYGFLFDKGKDTVLVAWSPVGKEQRIKFGEAPVVIDIEGNTRALGGDVVTLSNKPVFMLDVPDEIVRRAKANNGKPFPWGGDFASVDEVRWHASNDGSVGGLESIGSAELITVVGEASLRVKKGSSLSFRVNPGFAPFGTTNLEIKVVARRSTDQAAGMQMVCETLKTIHGYDRAGWWTVPEGEQWHEQVWKVTDANFVGTWGYNFTMAEISGELLVKEVSVRKLPRE